MSSESIEVTQPQARAVAPVLRRRKRSGLGFVTYGDLMRKFAPMLGRVLSFGALLLFVGAMALSYRRPEYVPYFVGISLSGALSIVCWFLRSGRNGLPILPLFILQQAAVYLTPLFMENESLDGYSPGVLATSAGSISLFLPLLTVGWALGASSMPSLPSRWNMKVVGRDGGRAKGMAIALAFLFIGVVFELLTYTGLIYDLLPPGLEGLFPVLRTFAAASETVGALVGGYVVTVRGRAPGAVYYWIMLAGLGALLISGVLISSATALVVAAAVGQIVGGRRVPWVFLLVALGTVGYLNLGKFTMRERYWPAKKGEAKVQVPLIGLPEFYAEWAAASMEKVSARQEVTEAQLIGASGDKGQSVFDRINNYQNMTFVLHAMQAQQIAPLWGKTYTLIPPLLIPRILWPDKPRTHEGQILLNLHFGRQGTVEQTEMTYIAWGLLPEAVGNFGAWFGPVVLGPVLGFIFGLLETWSRRKRLFSIEGLIAAGLTLQVLVSFEMVASVFVTSSLQMVVAVVLGGMLLRQILASGEGRER